MEKAENLKFQKIVKAVESLPLEEQALLVEIIHKRLLQHRRAELEAEISEARRAYKEGKVRRGTVADLMKELTE